MENESGRRSGWQRYPALVCVLVLLLMGVPHAQQAPPAPPAPPAAPEPPAQLLAPDQLDNLVAPIALYPDTLLSQILVASTYPLEVVEAWQWLQQNRNLRGSQLMDAARDQNWDPSIQALVTFPDVLGRLNQDVRWTTDLGNAFLAQQADVMDAVQRMRAEARASGKLVSTPQENVETQTEDGRTVIVVQPANPQVIYVPAYNPAYIWGPPVMGYYPPLVYPGFGFGLGFGVGINIGGFFGGCCGWGGFGWGWGPNWFGRNVMVNNYFLHRYGFNDFHGGAFAGRGVWAHDPEHRWGVPYPTRGLAERFRGGGGYVGGPAYSRRYAGPPNLNRAYGTGSQFNRGSAGERALNGRFSGRQNASIGSPRFNNAQRGRFGSPQFENRRWGGNHSVFGGFRSGGYARVQGDHGLASMQASRGGFSGPRGNGGGFHSGGFHGGGSRGGGFRGR